MKLLRYCAWMVLALTATAALGQSYPTRPVKLVIPAAPGGTSDFVGRTIAGKLAEVLGQPIAIENRPGAGETIGRDRHAHSTARLQRDTECSRQHRDTRHRGRLARCGPHAIDADRSGDRGDGLRLCVAGISLQRLEALRATIARERLRATVTHRKACRSEDAKTRAPVLRESNQIC